MDITKYVQRWDNENDEELFSIVQDKLIKRYRDSAIVEKELSQFRRWFNNVRAANSLGNLPVGQRFRIDI